MKNRFPCPRRQLLGAFGGAALAAAIGPARAAIGGLPSNTGHADSSPEWDALRARLFGTREIAAGSGAVRLDVPLRAAYGASVPIKIVSGLAQTPALRVVRMHLVVEKNPSPVAAVFEIGSASGQADFETRLRIDEYGHVRVVSELSNGELHMDSRFVKTSGGCSAPPNRDQLALIGKTLVKVEGSVHMGEPNTADVTVIHPNDTGLELNNQTVMTIPPHFVRSIRVSYDERKVFDATVDFSLSENPTLRFKFVPQKSGELRADVDDSKDGHYVGRLRVGEA